MVYRYRLTGYENWKNTLAHRVEYQNLPRGNYTFEVQAVDRDLVYSEAPATMTVNVHLPYERIGLMSALGIAIALIGWQAVRIIRRDRRLHETNNALSEANHDLFGLNKDLQENTKALELASMQAQQANQAKSRFLANMSHELRTPLNGILGYAQILNRDKGLDEKQLDGVGIIRRSGEHLLGLINDILDLARIEAERIELEEEAIGLPTFLENVSEISSVRAQQKGLAFVYDPPSDLPEVVRGDPRRLRQALLNLLGNAVKFTEKGDVQFLVGVVSQTQEQVRLRFEILDTGAGMTETEAREVFKPFEQAGGAKQRAEGTGLGLAISQQLVGLMGGEIQVESTPNKGSRFWFEANLIAVDEQEEITVQDERVPVGYKGDSRQILVVDDKVENRALLVSFLEPLGFEVREAEDGQASLDLAVETRPDVILLDLVMPVLDGYETARRLRQVTEQKDTVVIALSASVFEHERQQSLDAGCTDFLPKPVIAEDLFEKIGEYLDLEWTYEEVEERSADISTGEMVMPPVDVLMPLFEVAQKGQIFALEGQIDGIAKLGEVYGPFVSAVQKLAGDFKVDQICALIKPHLGGQDE
jgi:signal transduction histidine kinase/FixJ family two-component response regulator